MNGRIPSITSLKDHCYSFFYELSKKATKIAVFWKNTQCRLCGAHTRWRLKIETQKVYGVCVRVVCSVFPVFFCNKFSRLLIDLTLWFLAVVLANRLFRTLNPAIQEIGWAMPHSDFLAWLSSATLKIIILGVSSQILIM